MEIRVRIAPSPTGSTHVGLVRSALFNQLFAESENGKFILRIEDTDLERSTKESEESIIKDLKWSGIRWDEGPDIGGEYAPYRQSERLDIYRKMANKLVEDGKAYYCFCSDEEIEERKKQQIKKGLSHHYDGKCRSIPKEDALKRIKSGENHVIRFKALEEDIIFKDLVRGELKFEQGVVGDFIIMRSNGIPTYNFAVVIDDIDMKISHVFRGEEHLSNTPKQIMLYKAFNKPIPEFGHLSILLGEDRQKLSKRNGSSTVALLRSEGILSEAMINYLFLLGWTSHSDQEIFKRNEMSSLFNCKNLVKNPQIFDIKKLRWINHKYIIDLPDESLVSRTLPFMDKSLLANNSKEFIKRVILSCRNDMEVLSDINKRAPFFFKEPEKYDETLLEFLPKIDILEKLFNEYIARLSKLEKFEKQEMHATLKALGKELQIKGKQLFIPMRLALTGQEEGPGVYDIIYAIGIDNTKIRFNKLILWLSKREITDEYKMNK